MTTTARPLPPHGSYARANGVHGSRGPCHCGPCRAIHRRTKKRNKVNRQLGRQSRVPAGPAQAHLKTLNETMTWPQIGAATGCDPGNLRQIANGHVPVVLRATHDKILATRQETPGPGKYVDVTGTVRRVQALRAIGYSPAFIAKAFGFSETHVRMLSRGDHPRARQRIATKVAEVFAQLATTPAPSGTSATMARNFAAANGWAPPGAWDDIDDPAATPDWTGHCGTDRGWWLHSVNNIPVCLACNTAHQQWKNERAHLTAAERCSELSRAKGAASNRGATLAADARELMRITGHDVEQIAERLGVTKAHLYQELLRHPEVDQTADTPEPADAGLAA